MDEVGLDLAERLALDDDGVDLVLVRRHQAAEPRPLRQLGRTLGRRVVVRLLGDCGGRKRGFFNAVLINFLQSLPEKVSWFPF